MGAYRTMKFDINRVSIGFFVVIALISLFIYGHKENSCDENDVNCVCEEKVKLDTTVVEGRLSITPYTQKFCKKVTK
jgi:hypothetical protein